MIVVLLLSIVYTVAIISFQKLEQKKKPSIKNFVELSSIYSIENLDVLCYDYCLKCDVFDSKKNEKIGNFNLPQHTKAYSLYGDKLSSEPRGIDLKYLGVYENICFELKIRDGLSANEALLSDGASLFYYRAQKYLPDVFESIGELEQYLQSAFKEMKETEFDL